MGATSDNSGYVPPLRSAQVCPIGQTSYTRQPLYAMPINNLDICKRV